MIKTIPLIFLILIIFAFRLRAQQATIHGKVVDSISGEPMEGVVIKVTKTNKVIITGESGTFVVRDESQTLNFHFMGYLDREINVDAGKPMLIKLQKCTILLKDVCIGTGQRLDTYKILSSLDLNMQPVKSTQDLLRLVPGLFIAQHMGGGKAEQIFLRGFDADHGTDVNISVDGIPVNMVSHAHGQGYADLHFVIPETVESYDFGKGPYYADKGDFTTAGFVAYTTKTVLDQDMIKLEGGQFNSYRGVALINLLDEKAAQNGNHAYIAAEGLYSNGGPFQLPEHFKRFNIFGKFSSKMGQKSCLTGFLSYFRSNWQASGEIPERAVEEGYISNRFGALDSAQGGHTERTNASLKLTSDLSNGWTLENQLWYSHYYFNLVSNFTFYYYFPVTGDEFRQMERRNLGGYNGKISKTGATGNTTISSVFGYGLRYDHISPLETDHTEDGNFLGNFQLGTASELDANIYWDESLRTGNWLFNSGLRMDYYYFNYNNLLPSADTLFPGIDVQKTILSPKISVAYDFSNNLQLYLKTGKGFHSNDARVVVANQGLEVLPAAYGADIGINWKPMPDLYINSALWYLYLQQEFTFGQDLSSQVDGPVTPSGKTRRLGIDLSGRYQINSWLFANLNANFARPRYIDSLKGHNYVPLAPTFTSTAALDFRLKNGINGGLSYRYLHDRAANSDYSLNAKGYFITDLAINYTTKRYELGLSIENLLNSTWDESQFEYTSRLKNETMPVDEVSYTPGVPFFAKLKWTMFF